jgi:hypothetical protein
LKLLRQSTSQATDSLIPSSPTVAPATGVWGIGGYRHVHSVGLDGGPADGVMEETALLKRVLMSACFSSDGDLRISGVVRSVSSSWGLLLLACPHPGLVRRRIWRNKKWRLVFRSFASSSAAQAVGSPELTIGDYPAAMGQASFQGARSCGRRPPPTAPVLRRVRDLAGLRCNFPFFSGSFCKNVAFI